MSEAVHAAYMRRALDLARKGWGMVQPNPLVGAIVVQDGEIVGEGWHRRYGGPHAEVEALRAAGDAARGATLYVTLEPCAHHGKTPPCTDAIAAAGIAEVVYAIEDPGTESGGGSARLRAAGVRATAGVERAAARRLNAPFFHTQRQHAPFITLKLAVSLDGRIAARAGERSSLTGPAAQAETHRLRAGSDAVLVGIRTALTDDPLLTVRDVPVRVQPARVVLDTDARLPVRSQLVATAGDAPVCVVCAPDADPERVTALQAAGVRVLRATRAVDGLALDDALRALYDAGMHSLFVEGGGRVATSLITASLVHRLHLFIAPQFLGAAGVPAFTLESPGADWACTSTAQFGTDTLITLERPEGD